MYEPEKYRAYVPLQNVDAFYQAFEIKPGDGMYLEDDKRVKFGKIHKIMKIKTINKKLPRLNLC